MAKLWISQSKGCWVDLFEGPLFSGRSLRLFGPADFVNLWVGHEEWGDEARSIAVHRRGVNGARDRRLPGRSALGDAAAGGRRPDRRRLVQERLELA